MNPAFEFATAARIVFGSGSVQRIGSIALEFGTRALLVTGGDPRRAEPVLLQLAAQKIKSVTFKVSGEPVVTTVRAGVAAAKAADCQFVIAHGGGSALDTGKAIAAMMSNPGDVLDYLEVIGHGKSLKQPSAPVLAVPTTAGTGSEVTRNAVLGSPEHRVKVSLRSPSMLPAVALVDPDLTRDLPAALTAATGLDALTQLIEPYVCLRSNPITDGFCLEGLRRVAASLRAAFQNGHDSSAREDMSLAAVLGGLSLANAGLGAVHGIAGPFGGMFSAPHGAICAALLPGVMAANLNALRRIDQNSPALDRFVRIAQILTGRANGTADDGVSWVRELVADLKIPRLSTYGAGTTDAAELIEKSLRSSSMKANPVLLASDELEQIYLGAL